LVRVDKVIFAMKQWRRFLAHSAVKALSVRYGYDVTGVWLLASTLTTLCCCKNSSFIWNPGLIRSFTVGIWTIAPLFNKERGIGGRR